MEHNFTIGNTNFNFGNSNNWVKDPDGERRYFPKNTIVRGIECKRCKMVLPPHTMEEHLDTDFVSNLHKCPIPIKKNEIRYRVIDYTN